MLLLSHFINLSYDIRKQYIWYGNSQYGRNYKSLRFSYLHLCIYRHIQKYGPLCILPMYFNSDLPESFMTLWFKCVPIILRYVFIYYWLFHFNSLCLIVVSVLIPGSLALQKQRKSEALQTVDGDMQEDKNFGKDWRQFPRALLNLVNHVSVISWLICYIVFTSIYLPDTWV